MMPMAVVSYDKSNTAPHFNCFYVRNSVLPYMMPLMSCDANANNITGSESHILPHFNNLILRNAAGLLASHDAKLTPAGSHDQKSHVAPNFICTDLRNTMITLTVLFCHMMPVSVPVVSHNQRRHFAPHFNCLGVRNVCNICRQKDSHSSGLLRDRADEICMIVLPRRWS